MLISKFKGIDNPSGVLKDKIKHAIPEEYSNFLEKYNGGYTPKTTIKIGRKQDDIVAFYGVGLVDKTYSFDILEKIGILQDFLSHYLLPIATNSGGDYYTLSLDKDDWGSVYLHTHDIEGKRKLVSSGFVEFLSEAKSQVIGKIKTLEEREALAISNGYAHKIEKLKPIWEKEIKKFSTIKQEKVEL